MTQRRRGPAEYWSIVFRQFRRHRLARACWWVIIGLFTVAIFAPFLASERPLALFDATGASFPVLAHLTREDVLWLAGLAAAIAGRIAYALLKRRAPEKPQLLRSIVVGAVLIALCACGVFITMRDRGDREDWGQRVASVERAGGSVVRTPIPFGPSQHDLMQRLLEPGRRGHLIGTDSAGRDVFARMIWGTRVSLIVGFVAVALYVAIGVVVGALAGYFGGRIDMIASRLIEIMACFPTLFLILAVLAFLPPSIWNIMVLLGVTGWPGVARLVRGEFLRLRGMDFVAAGQALGASSGRMIFRHVLPNALAPVLVTASFGVAGAITLEAGLSFLGFGVPPPTPSWGSILFDARPYALTHPWLSLYPGLAIFVTVTAYNLVGDGLRDAMDPRLVR